MSRVNFGRIIKLWSIVLMALAFFSLTGLSVSIFYGDSMEFVFIITCMICLILGGSGYAFSTTNNPYVSKKDGYIIVFGSWIIMSFFGAIPFMISDTFSTPVDAIFESVSGFTTTGASILTSIESQPHSILYWRSLTQWIGGMGIIVLTVALLPLLGIGGVEIFTAESSLPAGDKIHPRIVHVARKLWLVYVVLTFVCCCLYWYGGMNMFDAVNHSFTTLATGGFSTKDLSMGHFFNMPIIIYTSILFMFLAGTNFTLLYYTFTGKLFPLLRNDEFKTYAFVIIASLVLMILVKLNFSPSGFDGEATFRHLLFQIVSIITTTGYATIDFQNWGVYFTFGFLIMFFFGACAGSTSGSFKMVRHLVLFRYTLSDIKRVFHPNAVIPVKINGQQVEPKVITHILAFLLLYLFLFALGAFILMITGLDFMSSLGASATAITNVGPGIGSVGPADNFAHVPEFGKVVLMFLMLAGRLELFTVIIFFTPEFWK